MTRALPILLACLGVACASGAESPAGSSSAPVAEAAPVADEGPPGAAAIASLLSARHTRDLPDEATLRAHEDPAAALRWIASSHRRMVVRARALSSLRYFADDATRAHLIEVLGSDAHPMLLAAAATGSERLALDEVLGAALERARGGGDPRVERAVTARLGSPAPALPGAAASATSR